MADDNSQRPFRSADLKSRATPTASNPSASNNDPLAELARLIGQSDPFGEFGREGGRQPAAPQPSVRETEPMLRALAAQIPTHDPLPEERSAAARSEGFPAGEFARQPYGSAPLAGDGDLYQTPGPVPGYEDHAVDAGGYEGAAYDPNVPRYTGETHEYYDDVPPPRRRMGVLAIAAVFALAIIGTAGAFGYRALFGSAGSGPPPVIKADTTPSKIVPDIEKEQSAKLINDRVNNAGDQKLVSREERPVDINRDNPAGVLTRDPSMATGAMQTPAIGSGVIGSDPKKINTITIRPDQAGMVAAAPAETPQTNVAGTMPAQPAPEPEPAPTAERESATPPPTPAPRRTATERPAPASRQVAAASSNAPLSLTPDAVAAPARAAPARTASAPTRLAPPAAASASGGYAVQVSSRRSEADAQAALQRMQNRFSSVLGGQQVMVRRVDLGAKGIYYRAMVGPFGSSEQANSLCNELKAAGGSCFVQRI